MGAAESAVIGAAVLSLRPRGRSITLSLRWLTSTRTETRTYRDPVAAHEAFRKAARGLHVWQSQAEGAGGTSDQVASVTVAGAGRTVGHADGAAGADRMASASAAS